MHAITIRWFCCGLILLFAGVPLHAREDVVLGQATVPDRSDAARAAALPAALADALRRLSPEVDPGAGIDTAAALAADETLLQRFDYAQVTRPTASGIPSIKRVLRAWFHAVPARDLLVRAGLMVWRGGNVAPTFWLVDESDDGRRLLDPHSHAGLQTFADALEERGVRVLWAVNDLADWRMVEVLTPETAPSALSEVVERTSADPAVLAWIRHVEEGATVDWFVQSGAADRRFSSAGATTVEALMAGAPRLLEAFAEGHAVRPEAVAVEARDLDRGAGEYVIWLENIQRAGAYAQAIALLQGQSMVASLTPEQAAADRVRLRVQLTAPLAQLLALIAADGRLALSPTSPEDADLALRWQD